LVLVAAIAGKASGADDFQTYPTVEIGLGPATLALSTLVALSGLAPLRRRGRVSTSSRIAGANRHREVARV
jgi:hypothetical protein